MRRMAAPALALLSAIGFIVDQILNFQQLLGMSLAPWFWPVVFFSLFFLAVMAIIYGQNKRVEALERNRETPAPPLSSPTPESKPSALFGPPDVARVRTMIRDWLDVPGFSVEPQQYPDRYFSFIVTNHGDRDVVVSAPVATPPYVKLWVGIVLNRGDFQKLLAADPTFAHRLSLELTRMDSITHFDDKTLLIEIWRQHPMETLTRDILMKSTIAIRKQMEQIHLLQGETARRFGIDIGPSDGPRWRRVEPPVDAKSE